MAIDDARTAQVRAAREAQTKEETVTARVARAALSYLIPTFVLGFVWHLVLFKDYYEALAMYRHDVIIPFGLLSMAIQALLFAWVYEREFRSRPLAYAAFGFALSWSFTTIAVAAKNVMTSVPNYLMIETGFTLVQWAIVAPCTAFLLHNVQTRAGGAS